MKNKKGSSKKHPAWAERRRKTKHHIVAGLEAQLLRRVRADESMSRVELARKLGLAPSTISIYVDRLIADGFLLEKAKVERAWGRPPQALGLNPAGGHFIGVDFEARNIMATAVDFSQKPVRQTRDVIQAADTVEIILGKIEKAISTVMGNERKVLAIGVGVPGSIEPRQGVALRYRHIPGWENIPLAERLQRRFAVPVFLENNIRSMALAELWFGQGRGVENFLCIGVRSGIGTGIILHGQLYRGSSNLAGEIANWPSVVSLGKTGDAPPALARLEEVVSRDGMKQHSVETVAQVLSVVLGQLNLAFNPEKIILAGEITALGDAFLRRLQEQVKVISVAVALPEIVNSSLGDFNGALGAAALAVQQWKPVRA